MKNRDNYEAMAVKCLIFKNRILILKGRAQYSNARGVLCSAEIRHQSNPTAQCEQRSNAMHGGETFERSQQQKQ